MLSSYAWKTRRKGIRMKPFYVRLFHRNISRQLKYSKINTDESKTKGNPWEVGAVPLPFHAGSAWRIPLLRGREESRRT